MASNRVQGHWGPTTLPKPFDASLLPAAVYGFRPLHYPLSPIMTKRETAATTRRLSIVRLADGQTNQAHSPPATRPDRPRTGRNSRNPTHDRSDQGSIRTLWL